MALPLSIIDKKHYQNNYRSKTTMARPRKRQSDERQPPIQFRVESDLAKLVHAFAEANAMNVHAACKALVALAVNELDCRYYGLLHAMAEGMGGANAFSASCSHVRAALEGARRATGAPLQLDPERAVFIWSTVVDFFRGRGLSIDLPHLSFLPPEHLLAAEAAREHSAHQGHSAEIGDQASKAAKGETGKKPYVRKARSARSVPGLAAALGLDQPPVAEENTEASQQPQQGRKATEA
jgi:hypothetical protein